MARLRKPLPKFGTEEEEAEYWDNHSLLEHFDESDFKPLQVKAAKDRPITIRLDSESRQLLDQIAAARKVGPSTLSRMFITRALEQWRREQQVSTTLEDAAKVLVQRMSGEFRRLFARDFCEALGYRIIPDDELQNDASAKPQTAETSGSR